MKKVISLSLCVILALAVSLSFTSCKKEGVYNPKKKITAIYYQYPGTAKMLQEQWTWDGNLLTKIQYYYGGTYSHSNIYKYDGKRLIEVNVDGDVIKFTYDGSKLEKIEMWRGNNLEMSGVVTHDKSKISEIEFTEYESAIKSGKQNKMFTALRGFVIPESTVENMGDFHKKMVAKGGKSSYVYNVFYTYDGGNIVEERYVYGAEEYTYAYTYDKEKNPFYYLLYGGSSYSDLEFSKNNIVNVLATDSDQETSETEFSYVYDGGYPVERTVTYVTQAYSGGTHFYEYK